MTINILIGSLLINKKNIAQSFSQWPLVIAFIRFSIHGLRSAGTGIHQRSIASRDQHTGIAECTRTIGTRFLPALSSGGTVDN